MRSPLPPSEGTLAVAAACGRAARTAMPLCLTGARAAPPCRGRIGTCGHTDTDPCSSTSCITRSCTAQDLLSASLRAWLLCLRSAETQGQRGQNGRSAAAGASRDSGRAPPRPLSATARALAAGGARRERPGDVPKQPSAPEPAFPVKTGLGTWSSDFRASQNPSQAIPHRMGKLFGIIGITPACLCSV